MLKMKIRSFTIYYCRQNAKTKKAEEAVLQQKLSSRQKLMCENPTQETYWKLLRDQNETRADFIAQNRGRNDSE